jgi:hypothetical protein
MSAVSKLSSEIDELHARCNALRRTLGHATTPASDVGALKQQHTKPEAALMQLRDAKVSELQLLALRCCGHSTRSCHGGAPRQPGDRFNLALLFAVADCMCQQQEQLKCHKQRSEALQSENRALRERTGQPPAPGGAAAPPPAAGRPRPASAGATAGRTAQPRPPPARPAPAAPQPFADGDFDDGASSISMASGRTAAATAAAAALLAAGGAASARGEGSTAAAAGQQQQQQQQRGASAPAAAAAVPPSTLRHLDLGGLGRLTDTGLHKLLSRTRHLTSLDLRGCARLTEDGLANALANSDKHGVRVPGVMLVPNLQSVVLLALPDAASERVVSLVEAARPGLKITR